ncbi:MAG: endonuclease III [Bacteroidota bacterium]
MKIESPVLRKKRGVKIVAALKKEFQEAGTALHFSNPLQLLIATMLSAQCTDVRINMVTPMLFAKYKTAKNFAEADLPDLENDIRSTGFYHMKAKNIINACKILETEFHGILPQSMELLTKLPGVGRKTANCVLGGAFGLQEGVVVDTHVARISKRLGLTGQTDPEKIEQDLISLIPRSDWYLFSNLIILHGRKTCIARNPKCKACSLLRLCLYDQKTK